MAKICIFGRILNFIFLHKTNVMGTLNMLGLAKRVGARFLLTSTSEVYGDPLEHPQSEAYWGNVNPIGKYISTSEDSLEFLKWVQESCLKKFAYLWTGVRSCYDEGKRTAETLTMDYHRGLNLEVIRFLSKHYTWISTVRAVIYIKYMYNFFVGKNCSNLQHLWTAYVHWWWSRR